MTNSTAPLRKLGDKLYCKSFGDNKLYHVRIVRIVTPEHGCYPYQVQEIGTSFTWWIDEVHIKSRSSHKD